jgi:hypothetical protein
MLMSDITCPPTGELEYDLFIAQSADLQNWRLGSRKIFTKRPFRSRAIYRSTAICYGQDIYVYFSYRSIFKEWKIGVVRERLSDLFGN